MTLSIDHVDQVIFDTLSEEARNPLFAVEPPPPLATTHPLIVALQDSRSLPTDDVIPRALHFPDETLLPMLCYDIRLALARQPRRRNALGMLDELIERAQQNKIAGDTFYRSYLDCGCAFGSMLRGHGDWPRWKAQEHLRQTEVFDVIDQYVRDLRQMAYYGGSRTQLLAIEIVAFQLVAVVREDDETKEEEEDSFLFQPNEEQQRCLRLIEQAAEMIRAIIEPTTKEPADA